MNRRTLLSRLLSTAAAVTLGSAMECFGVTAPKFIAGFDPVFTHGGDGPQIVEGQFLPPTSVMEWKPYMIPDELKKALDENGGFIVLPWGYFLP